MTTQHSDFLHSCGAQYKGDLLGNVMPFWLKNGLDNVNGGVYTCVDRDGTLIDTTKSVWFQGRFAYTCALVYNKMDRDPKYLEAARATLGFIEKHCFDTDGHMFFEVTADGRPLRRRRYIFSECFATIAMAEYALATDDQSYADKAVALLKSVLQMMGTPGFLPAKYLPTVEMKGLSPLMILINTARVVKQVSTDPILDEIVKNSLDEIEKYFIKPEFSAVLETVGQDGQFIDTCAGRMINPGHSIELAWFIFEATTNHQRREEYQRLALQIIDWSWAWGWDKEYGGIINFRDCRNLPVQEYSQDMKFWWPQCETIIATLYAYKLTGDEKYLEMHRQIHDYTYRVFPDPDFGEWYGYLHRDGTVAQHAKGNLFKGPFHIPRMMVYAAGLCDQILDNEKQ